MKWHTQATGLLFVAFASTPAFADGHSAVHNLFSNLTRARASLNVDEASVRVSPTLVRGVYSLANPQGGFIGFTNESGTLFGDYRGLNVVSTSGARPRPLNPAENAEVRAEVVAAIDYDKLPKLSFGNGGGRRLLMFSAVDCPACKVFEDGMRRNAAGLNSTIYVVPSSLQPISQGGSKSWQTVSRLWCADDAGTAWRSFWATRDVPQSRQCQFAEPRAAEASEQQLKEILRAVGVKVDGTPQIVREDGSLIADVPNLSPSYVSATFGPAGVPQPSMKPMRWLTASVDGLPTATGNDDFDLKKLLVRR